MRKFIPWIKRHFLYKIRYQITIFLFFVTFLPVISIQLFNYEKTSEMLFTKNHSLLADNLQLTQNSINNVLTDYKRILFQISTDVTCMDNILELSKVSPDSAEYRRISESLETYIKANILMYPEIQALCVISTTGTPYIYVQKRQKTQPIIDYFEANKEELNQLLLSSTRSIIGSVHDGSPYYDPEHPVFFLGSRTIHYEKMKITGSILLFISPDKMNSAINNPDSQVYPFTDKLLVDSSGRLICSKDRNTGKILGSLENYKAIDWDSLSSDSGDMQGDYLVSQIPLEHFDLHLINIVDYRQMTKDLEALWTTITLAISAILLVSMLVAYVLCHKFIFSIENVAAKMNLFDEHHLDVEIRNMSRNELRIIESSFNRMLGQIRGLLDENKQQYKKICEAELKSLELQINPHFLFNTLDSICWTAAQENCLTVSEQLNKLAAILRHTVYNMNCVVPLQDEICWMQNYLDLQKSRFHGRFYYDIHDLTKGRRIYIHKLLLQPFLENALIHGFENLPRKGRLEIACRITGQSHLLLQVSDNGCGIPEDKVREINLLFTTGRSAFTGIGLTNIAYRTKGYYPHSRIFVSSSPMGTCFKIFIPMNEME